MEKYKILIEFLKLEYLASILTLDEQEKVLSGKYKEQALQYFSIENLINEVNIGVHVKSYHITDRQKGYSWAIMLVPARALCSSLMLKFREQLIKQCGIQGIFTLKKDFFKKNIIPTAVIVLNKGSQKTWFTSAVTTEDVINLMEDIGTYTKKVYFTDDIDPESFMPDHYRKTEELSTKLEQYKSKSLIEIADIVIGKDINKKEISDAGIPYLSLKNIKNNKICDIDTYVCEDAAEKYGEQILRNGDILLSKNLSQYKVVQIKEEDLPAIASNDFFIIRVFGVPESYMYQYLLSDTGEKALEKQLSDIGRSTVIMSIGLRELKELIVPIYDKQTMLDMGDIDKINVSRLSSVIPMERQLHRLAAYAEKIGSVRQNRVVADKIFSDFLQAGWESSEVVSERAFTLSNGTRWNADMVLENKGNILAVLEVKTDFTKITEEWFERVKSVLVGEQIPCFILTTGTYYEVHYGKMRYSKKMISAPNKEWLLSVLGGKEE